MNIQIAILEIEGNFQSFALNRREQCGVDVEIDRVAEFVTFACCSSFNPGREINSVVASGRALTKTSEQVSKGFVTEKIESLLGNFETNVAWQRLGKHLALSRGSTALLGMLRRFFVKRQITFFNESLDQLIQQFFEQRTAKLAFVLADHFTDLLFVNKPLVHERLKQR